MSQTHISLDPYSNSIILFIRQMSANVGFQHSEYTNASRTIDIEIGMAVF